MKTRECPSCAMEVDATAKTCPVCQYEFTDHSRGVKWLAILLVLVFLAYLLVAIL